MLRWLPARSSTCSSCCTFEVESYFLILFNLLISLPFSSWRMQRNHQVGESGHRVWSKCGDSCWDSSHLSNLHLRTCLYVAAWRFDLHRAIFGVRHQQFVLGSKEFHNFLRAMDCRLLLDLGDGHCCDDLLRHRYHKSYGEYLDKQMANRTRFRW